MFDKQFFWIDGIAFELFYLDYYNLSPMGLNLVK
jgi:hypothetical protein